MPKFSKGEYYENLLKNLNHQQKDFALKWLNKKIGVNFIFGILLLLYLGYFLYENQFMDSILSEENGYILVLISLVFLSTNSGYIIALISTYRNISKDMGNRTIINTFLLIITLGIAGFFSKSYEKTIHKQLAKAIVVRHGAIENSNSNEVADDGLEFASLGYDYLYGLNGKEINKKSSLSYFNRAAKLGNTTALLQLGFMSEDDSHYEKAYDYYQEAFDKGNAKGAYFIARLVEKGHGFIKSEKKAFEWYLKAANQGESLSQYYVGLEYIKGKIVKKDTEIGLQYIHKSADQSSYDALFYLGLYYGTDLQKDHFDLKKAEQYFVQAIDTAEDDEEKASTYNELGRLWMAMWSQTNKEEHYQLALQLFYAGKKLNHSDAKSNYMQAAHLRPSTYQSIDVLLETDLILSYKEKVLMLLKNSSQAIETEELDEETEELQPTEIEKPIPNKENPKQQAEMSDLKDLSRSLLFIVIFKSICFGAGLYLFLWTRNNAEQLMMLIPFSYVLSILVAGLPGLPKAFNSSYNYNEKWDRFFGTPEYKAVVDYDRNKVTIKKNKDWLGIILTTLMNMAYQALVMPFEIIRDIYRFIIVISQIRKLAKEQV